MKRPGIRRENTMAEPIRLRVDGTVHELTVDDEKMPLLYALRDDLGMPNPRFGCGLAQCGACTVLVDGKATRSCVTPVSAVAGHEVTTLAGLGTPERPHPLQTAFAAEEAMQCGYCINGWIMTAAALLKTERSPSRERIKEALGTLVCRCGSHTAILRAVERAAKEHVA
jgi:nicotinate dehydrogenase subunit A